MNINSVVDKAYSLIDMWVEVNKPTKEAANQLSEVFLKEVQISGSNEFRDRIGKTIRKASLLASGSVILQRLLNSNKGICIEEGLENRVSTESQTITLNLLNHASYVVCLNSNGEPICSKSSRIATLLHELIHVIHLNENAGSSRVRKGITATYFPGMDDGEEEFTIAGDLMHGEASKADFCCEWTVQRELKHLLRINHRGAFVSRGNPLTLKQMIEAFALGSIKEVLASGRTNDCAKDVYPLEFAFDCWFHEEDEDIRKERDKLMNFLIDSGFQSSLIFKMALLMRKVELVNRMCKNGLKFHENVISLIIKSDPEFELANLFTENWKVNFFSNHKDINIQISENGNEANKIIVKNWNKLNRSINQLTSDQELELVQLLLDNGAKVSYIDFNEALLHNSPHNQRI